jgi:CubicO group peptidase (beta-lactamase class C family)
MAVRAPLSLDIDAALAYAQRHGLHALVITRNGRLAFECYGQTYASDRAHAIYSGTKSFWGVLAVAAQEDGMLALDEPVARTIAEWSSDQAKKRITIRQLLNLTAGFGFGGLGKTVPLAKSAIKTPLKTVPGTAFSYGGIPLQIFGEVLRRKLSPRNLDPHTYLRQRILDPVGLRIDSWRTLSDGTHPLPTGAMLAPAEWIKFGQLILERGAYKGKPVVGRAAIGACFEPSEANPHYGLGFWLSPEDSRDIVYASGSGGQAMYVLWGAEAVVVHFGDSRSWKHETFLKRLLGNGGPGIDPKPRGHRKKTA